MPSTALAMLFSFAALLLQGLAEAEESCGAGEATAEGAHQVLAARAGATHLELIPRDDARDRVGEVRGLDLSKPLSDAEQEFLRAAIRKEQVIVCRGQTFNDEELLRFADVFGGTQVSGARAYEAKAGLTTGNLSGILVSENEQLNLVTNLGPDGKPVARDSVSGGSMLLPWHTDQNFVEVPASLTLLYAVENIGNDLGNTSFADQYQAVDSMIANDPSLVARIQNLHVKHDSSRRGQGELRPSLTVAPANHSDVPGSIHPIIRQHPVTCRNALYLGRRYAGFSNHIVEMPNDEGDELFESLFKYAVNEQNTYQHSWKKNDLLIWDNRCVMHQREEGDPMNPRVMKRALIKGDAVIKGTVH